MVDIDVAVLTTGTALDIGNANLLTTGQIAVFESNAPDASTRYLVQMSNDNTAATGATVLSLRNASTGQDVLVANTDPGTLGAKIIGYQISASPAVGDSLLRIRADGRSSAATQRQYGYIQFVIADATNASEDCTFDINLISAGSNNLAAYVDSTGQLFIDLSSGAGTATVFDEYDDVEIIRRWTPVLESRMSVAENFKEMGIAHQKSTGSGWMLNVQKAIYFGYGGIGQLSRMFDAMTARFDRLAEAVKRIPGVDSEVLRLIEEEV